MSNFMSMKSNVSEFNYTSCVTRRKSLSKYTKTIVKIYDSVVIIVR